MIPRQSSGLPKQNSRILLTVHFHRVDRRLWNMEHPNLPLSIGDVLLMEHHSSRAVVQKCMTATFQFENTEVDVFLNYLI